MNSLECLIHNLEERQSFMVDKTVCDRLANDNEVLEVLQCKIEGITVRYKGKLLASAYSPSEEAKKRVELNKEIFDNNLIVVHGFGIGYELEHILNRKKVTTKVLVLIYNESLFFKLNEYFDYKSLIEHDDLILVNCCSSKLQMNLKLIANQLFIQTQRIGTIILQDVYVGYADEIMRSNKLMSEMFKYGNTIIGNNIRDTLEGIIHIVMNYKTIISAPNLNELRGSFHNTPAICIASGPSLDISKEQLKQMDNKAVIFCVASNVHKLVDEGIKADFVTVLERTNDLYDLVFKNKRLPEEIILAGASVINQKIFEDHPGVKLPIFRNYPTEVMFSHQLNNMNSMDLGLSVANFSLSLATYLGFNPIILVGQDLAYGTDGKTHTTGTIYDNEDISESLLSDFDEFYVNGLNNDMVKTNRFWDLYRKWFENFIAKEEPVVINATPYGAHIEGTIVMSLEDSIKQYCSHELETNVHEVIRNIHINQEKNKNAFVEALNIERENCYFILNQFSRIDDLFIQLIKAGNKQNTTTYIDAINEAIELVVDKKVFSSLMLGDMVNLGRRNIELGNINSKEQVERLKNNFDKFFATSRQLIELLVKLFSESLDFIVKDQPFSKELSDLIEYRNDWSDFNEQL